MKLEIQDKGLTSLSIVKERKGLLVDTFYGDVARSYSKLGHITICFKNVCQR